ncbi:MAG: polysaccharide pyruvyl transferase family protein [Rhodothalassiaceae bacterium]
MENLSGDKAEFGTADLCQRLRDEILRVLAPLIAPHAGRLLLVDPADYGNVGDHAIHLGQFAYLDRAFPTARLNVLAEANVKAGALRAVDQADLVLFQGGGNFGDLYPRHHAVRLAVMRQKPEVPKLHFPQSIFFQEERVLEETRRVIAQQSNFTLLVRDKINFEFAQSKFDCEIRLCPDMAFALTLPQFAEPDLDYSCLLRTDKEMRIDKNEALTNLLQGLAAQSSFFDWVKPESTRLRRRLHRSLRLWNQQPWTYRFTEAWVYQTWRAYAQERLEYGLRRLARGRTVITDRLHGHILATLLNRPQYVFDSMDGKVAAFFKCWTKESGSIVLVQSVEELRDLLSSSATPSGS